MIPLTRPYFGKEELEAIKQVLDSGWVAGQGPKNRELEAKFAEYINVKKAVCVANCTAALHLALLSLGIKQGDEVIVPGYTFPATSHAVMYVNAKPVFCDVDLKTYNIDPSLIEKKITKKTKAIIPVHLFGQAADMGAIMKIAKRHNLYVIEDCAGATGSRYKDKFCGAIGDFGCFSFHARKNISTGEGGIIASNNEKFMEHIKSLANFGMLSAWDRAKSQDFIVPEFHYLGYNYKLSDIAAAIGLVQLQKLESLIRKRTKLAGYYNKQLGKTSFIELPYVMPNSRHIYQSYVPLLHKRINRNKLVNLLKQGGIQANIGTYAAHAQPLYKSKDKCPNSLHLFEHSIALPIFYELTEEQIDYIVEKLRKLINKLK